MEDGPFSTYDAIGASLPLDSETARFNEVLKVLLSCVGSVAANLCKLDNVERETRRLFSEGMYYAASAGLARAFSFP